VEILLGSRLDSFGHLIQDVGRLVHRMTQARMCSPALSWAREVALLVRRANMLGNWMRPYELLELLEDHPDIETPGLKDDQDDLSDEKVRKRILQAIGRRLKQCFKSENQISIDTIDIERRETQDDQYRKCHEYRFSDIDRESRDTGKPSYDPVNPARESFFLFRLIPPLIPTI